MEPKSLREKLLDLVIQENPGMRANVVWRRVDELEEIFRPSKAPGDTSFIAMAEEAARRSFGEGLAPGTYRDPDLAEVQQFDKARGQTDGRSDSPKPVDKYGTFRFRIREFDSRDGRHCAGVNLWPGDVIEFSDERVDGWSVSVASMSDKAQGNVGGVPVNVTTEDELVAKLTRSAALQQAEERRTTAEKYAEELREQRRQRDYKGHGEPI